MKQIVIDEGSLVDVYLHTDQEGRGINGVIVQGREVSPETLHEVALHIAFAKPSALSREEVPKEDIERERESALGVTKAEGKPEAAWEKIVEGLGAKSIQRRLSAIRSFMNYLLREGMIKNNPAEGVKTPKAPKKLPGVLDIQEISQLLDIQETDPLSLRDKAIMELIYSSGLRLSEIVRLNPIDLNLSDKSLTVIDRKSVV